MKIAIVHEMLVKLGGAEKVVSVFCDMFPEADLFTLMYDEDRVAKDFPKEKISGQVFRLTTQRIYKLTKKQRLCLPFMPSSVEKLDFSGYDLVLVSSSGFAHGIQVGETTKVIVYSHSPARYMWDWTNEYREDIGWNRGLKGLLLGRFFLKLRQWDYYAAQNADLLLANSVNTASRVEKYHRRKAEILYPPVETERFATKLSQTCDTNKEYYIIISALTEFKKIEIAIEAFNNIPENKLMIVGAGNYENQLQEMSQKNIEFTGAQYGNDLVEIVQGSLGLIFPGEEDFGIVPIEVMAAGKPVFALRKGGLTETVIDGKTGAFFDDPEGVDFIEKFGEFHKQNLAGKYKSSDCQAQAAQFSSKIFKSKLQKYIDKYK